MYSLGYQGHDGVGLGGTEFWNLPVTTGANDSWSAENMAARRPFQEYRYQDRDFWTPGIGDSEYHGLVVRAQARTTHFRLQSWYTLARTRATDNGWFLETRIHPGSFDERDWATPNHARTHNFLVLPSWDLPVFGDRRDLLNQVFGGWNVTTLFNIQSGQNVNLVAQNNSFECQRCQITPNGTGQPFVVPDWRSNPALVYVNAAGFTQPANGTYGDLHRNAMQWPVTKNVDMTVMKTFRVYGESVKFDLRFDFFNLFNWVNWNVPGNVSTLAPANFRMTSYWTFPPREIQVGARLQW